MSSQQIQSRHPEKGLSLSAENVEPDVDRGNNASKGITRHNAGQVERHMRHDKQSVAGLILPTCVICKIEILDPQTCEKCSDAVP